MKSTTYNGFSFRYRETDYNRKQVGPEISIVMTAYNRPEQLLFTLKTIRSSVGNNISGVEVIIVDDSDPENFVKPTQLLPLKYPIKYIQIDKTSKTWTNPCINYNYGFSKVRGDTVIIQNSEVCHVGNVLDRVRKHLNPNRYMVFPVCAVRKQEHNVDIYSRFDNDPDVFHEKIIDLLRKGKMFNTNMTDIFHWYESLVRNSRGFHFLAAITRKNLEKMEGFDKAFALMSGYDDDDFVNRLKYHLNLSFFQPLPEDGPMGIHLWHPREKTNKVYDHFYKANSNDIQDTKDFLENKRKEMVDNFSYGNIIIKPTTNLVRLDEYKVPSYGTRFIDYDRPYTRGMFACFRYDPTVGFIYRVADLTSKKRESLGTLGIYYYIYQHDISDNKYEISFEAKAMNEQTVGKQIKIFNTKEWIHMPRFLSTEFQTYSLIFPWYNPDKNTKRPEQPLAQYRINITPIDNGDSYAIRNVVLKLRNR